MINLIENLCIDADENQYTLKLNTNRLNKKGETIYKTLGYYSTISSALEGASVFLIRNKIQNNDMTLKETLDEYKRIEKSMKELCDM